MQAIIFADRRGDELFPLNETQGPALLPVANQPLLQYAIEDLAAAGISHILVVAADELPQLEAHFGNGERMGVQLDYALSRGEEAADALLARLAGRLQPPFVALRGDMLRSPCCAAFLQACAGSPHETLIHARAGRANAGLCLVRDRSASLAGLSWPLATPGAHWLDLPDTEVNAVASLRQLFEANMTAMARVLADDNAPGWLVRPGVKAGRQCQLAGKAEGPTLLGAQSRTEAGARLLGGCVIGERCLLDRDCRLQRVLVLPNTHIGPGQRLADCIVSGHWRIPLATLRPERITDTAVQASLAPTAGASSWPERLLALVLLLLSLPLWPLALALSLLRAPRQPRLERWLPSLRAPAESFVCARLFATPMPLLRHLPLLGLVVTGRLRLFGAALTPATAVLPLPAAAPGLLSPQLVELDAGAPPEEVALAELAFTTECSPGLLLRRLARAARLLCSARAWRAPQEPAHD
ncbi:NDP-sugar synthase [Oceanimonas pelagia]|uniref:Translation initiation factor eIF2B subunit gamma n=1 Tax=Oceanimonas pelagia TaxID=3028314 RepID=A0AA50QB81_9GAMM|nr:NDP-sugar synthase [Oceanimonas pelagia]WMC09836.1 NDP-sugar synthase [Oceanimonas pelagia]